jgi:Holliday junction resolvase RusA-like endonuclease
VKTYIINGNPVPLARPRMTRNNVYDSQKDFKLIAGLDIKKQHGNDPMFEGPLHLDVTFFMRIPYPSSRDKKRKLCSTYHVTRPDLSNLLKFYEDVCTGILYQDDSLISSISCKKIYDISPRTEFSLRTI